MTPRCPAPAAGHRASSSGSGQEVFGDLADLAVAVVERAAGGRRRPRGRRMRRGRPPPADGWWPARRGRPAPLAARRGRRRRRWPRRPPRAPGARRGRWRPRPARRAAPGSGGVRSPHRPRRGLGHHRVGVGEQRQQRRRLRRPAGGRRPPAARRRTVLAGRPGRCSRSDASPAPEALQSTRGRWPARLDRDRSRPAGPASPSRPVWPATRDLAGVGHPGACVTRSCSRGSRRRPPMAAPSTAAMRDPEDRGDGDDADQAQDTTPERSPATRGVATLDGGVGARGRRPRIELGAGSTVPPIGAGRVAGTAAARPPAPAGRRVGAGRRGLGPRLEAPAPALVPAPARGSGSRTASSGSRSLRAAPL